MTSHLVLLWKHLAVSSIIRSGCWAKGEVYHARFTEGETYHNSMAEGEVYNPGFKQGEKVC